MEQTADQIEKLLPAKYAAYGALVAAIVPMLGRAYTSISRSGGIKGIWSAIVFGSSTVENKVNAVQTSKTGTGPSLPIILFAALLGWGTLAGCSTSGVTTASNINGAGVATVNAAMTGWAQYCQTHTVSSGSILAVSNAYSGYYSAELVLSNLTTVYVESSTTNTAALLSAEAQAIAGSSSNLLNIINSFTK